MLLPKVRKVTIQCVLLLVVALRAHGQIDTFNNFQINDTDLPPGVSQQLYENLIRPNMLNDVSKFLSFDSVDQNLHDVIVIPVVFHCVYHNDSEKISFSDVYTQLQVLNDDFNCRNTDLNSKSFGYSTDIGNPKIAFKLAHDSNIPSLVHAITFRHNTDSPFFISPFSVRMHSTGGVDAFDTEKYLNIWVCNMPKYLGYGSFPGYPQQLDGVVIDFRCFGTISKNLKGDNALGRTAVHEVGHYLGLCHTFGCNDNDCECTANDFVSDTPPQRGPNFGRPAYPRDSGCGVQRGDMFMNFMDLVCDDAMVMFTKEQALNMRAMFQPGGPRESLISKP